MPRPNTALIGIAGVHHIVSELSRRGLIALPTIRNTAAYDIFATTTGGNRHANIQVKASSKRVDFFRMPPSRKVKAGAHDYYVLVRWLPKENRFEGFILSGRAAKAEVQRGEAFQRRKIRAGSRKSIVPSIDVGPKARIRANHWRKRWSDWAL